MTLTICCPSLKIPMKAALTAPMWGCVKAWLPGQVLDRNSAITAMILADTAAEEDLREGHRLWPHVQGWAEELGLTGPEAVAAASQPPSDINREHDQADGQPDREAAD
jgi:hypothetical protein